jgi:ureidoglycolate hydrolase
MTKSFIETDDQIHQLLQEELEDTKGVIRIRKSKKEGKRNGQMKKDKQLSTKHTHKTKDRVTWSIYLSVDAIFQSL